MRPAFTTVPAAGLSPCAADALTKIPAYPDDTPLTAGIWAEVCRLMPGEHPVLAELSYFSIHCWRGGDAVRLSRIGPLFVVFFADEFGDAMLVSFPGEPLLPEHLDRVAELLETRSVRFLSAKTAAVLERTSGPGGCGLTRDRNDADYVYAMSDLAEYEGAEFRSKRRDARRFETRRTPSVRAGRLTDQWASDHLDATYNRWLAAKYGGGVAVPAAVRRERAGVDGWPRDGWAANVRVFCLEVEGEPVGVSVVEPMWDRTWMGVVMKTDPEMAGATAFLRRHVARAGLRELGDGGLLNIQQDEGLPGLRKAKESYRPVRLEPKYSLVRVGGPASKGRTQC